jgi:hypothetical protein
MAQIVIEFTQVGISMGVLDIFVLIPMTCLDRFQPGIEYFRRANSGGKATLYVPIWSSGVEFQINSPLT